MQNSAEQRVLLVQQAPQDLQLSLTSSYSGFLKEKKKLLAAMAFALMTGVKNPNCRSSCFLLIQSPG